MNSSFGKALAALALALACVGVSINVASAQSTDLTIGSSNTAVADPPVLHPDVKPVVVSLFSNVTFENFNPYNFTYSPPAGGPWAKVVLVGDFSISKGIQFDRTAEVSLGYVNVYYGTTVEDSPDLGPNWHFERDLTDYSSLLRASQPGEVDLGNLVNSTYTGIITGSVKLLFYPATSDSPAPETASQVLPLPDGPGGAAFLGSAGDDLDATFTFPTNVTHAYLDVTSESQNTDEQWFLNVPNYLTSTLESYGGSSFREAEVTVNGLLAGAAPVYPWIYTGGLDPYLWFPTPGVQTLNFKPYRVDLTPLASLLDDGKPHTIGISIYNDDYYFLVTGALLLYTDPNLATVTGGVTGFAVGAANPVIGDSIVSNPFGATSGPILTTEGRHIQLSGYVNTSKGRVDTYLDTTINYRNLQNFYIDDTHYVEDVEQGTQVKTSITVLHGNEKKTTVHLLSYPLICNLALALLPDGNESQTTSITQQFGEQNLKYDGDKIGYYDITSNNIATEDILYFGETGLVGQKGAASTQKYNYWDSDGNYWQRELKSVANVLTSATTSQHGFLK